MADPKITRVVAGQDHDRINLSDQKDVAAIGGIEAFVATGDQGVSYAGAGGKSASVRYGVAIVGPGGTAQGGAGTVVCAYDGGSASGGDGSIAWVRRDGPAAVGNAGTALALDGNASAGDRSFSAVTRQNKSECEARSGRMGVSVVRNHPALDPISRPATAVAGEVGVAIAFDGNHVEGAIGAFLVATYVDAAGQTRLAAGLVDDKTLKPDVRYRASSDGTFVTV